MAIWLQTEASTHTSDDGGLHGITECTQLTWNSSTKHTETQSAHMKALQRSIEAAHRGKLVSHNTVRPRGVAFDLSCAKPVQALDDNHGFSQHLVSVREDVAIPNQLTTRHSLTHTLKVQLRCLLLAGWPVTAVALQRLACPVADSPSTILDRSWSSALSWRAACNRTRRRWRLGSCTITMRLPSTSCSPRWWNRQKGSLERQPIITLCYILHKVWLSVIAEMHRFILRKYNYLM